MSFSDQTAAFFDELSSMVDEKKKENQGEVNPETGRPYSSLLTQDEEPRDHGSQGSLEQEPEVITRFSGGGGV
jgi:hypothetical protein